jgi:CBS domain containing-hemolysin-like protein
MFPILFIIKKMGFMDVTETQSSADELEEKREDLQHVYEQVNDKTTIEKDQQELITNVFEISEITVYEAMTPRTNISAVSKNDSLQKVLHTFIDSGHSNLPAYDKNVDNIIGVIYLYDLFDSPENLEDVIKPVHFTPYSKLLMDLMSEFQNSHHALAIVLDEHGGTAGLITAEDVFEELFGDFEDEFDTDTTEGVIHDDGSISVDAKMDCETYNDRFTDIFPEGDYETLGGFIISETGRIPNQGERLFTSIGQIEIIKASARLIVQIRIYPTGPE